jgi:hypothetical protein
MAKRDSTAVRNLVEAVNARGFSLTGRQVEQWTTGQRRYAPSPRAGPIPERLIRYYCYLALMVRPGRAGSHGAFVTLAFRNYGDMIDEDVFRDDIRNGLPVGRSDSQRRPRTSADVDRIYADIEPRARAKRYRGTRNNREGNDGARALVRIGSRPVVDPYSGEASSNSSMLFEQIEMIENGRHPSNSIGVMQVLKEDLEELFPGARFNGEQAFRGAEWFENIDAYKLRRAVKNAPIDSVVRNARILYPQAVMWTALLTRNLQVPILVAERCAMSAGMLFFTFASEDDLREATNQGHRIATCLRIAPPAIE